MNLLNIRNKIKPDFGFISTLFLLALLVIFLILINETPRGVFSSDWESTLYYIFYRNISKGLIVYKDFFAEYPPLAVYVLTFPMSLIKNIPHAVFLELYISNAGIWIGALFSINYIFQKKLHISNELINIFNIITLCLLGVLSYVSFARYDIFPAVLTTLSIVFYILYLNDRPKKYLFLSVALLTLGFSIKIYPILILPVIFLIEIYRKNFKSVILSSLIFIVLSSISLIFVLAGPQRFQEFLKYQSGRDLQIESVAASLMLSSEKAGLIHTTINEQNGAKELNDATSKKIARFSQPAIAFFSLLVYSFIFYKLIIKKKELKSETLALITIISSSILILIFLLFNNVFSPQYLIWFVALLPLYSLIFKENRRVVYFVVALSLFAAVCTTIIFPFFYGSLVRKSLFAITILLIRDLSLVTIYLILLKLLVKTLNQET